MASKKLSEAQQDALEKDRLPTKRIAPRESLWVVVADRGKAEGRWVRVVKHGLKYWYFGRVGADGYYVPREARVVAAGLSHDAGADVLGWPTANGHVRAYLAREDWLHEQTLVEHWKKVGELVFDGLLRRNPPPGLTVQAMRVFIAACGGELPEVQRG